jgi:DNA-binding beta-propeller fold protein YncE
MVATWGTGQVLEIDRMGNVHVVKRGFEKLDGIDFDKEGNLYVSSFEKGEIYKISRMGRGAVTKTIPGLMTPADISYDKNKDDILVPSMKGNTVSTVKAR